MQDTHTKELPFTEEEMMDMLMKCVEAELADNPIVDTEEYKCTDEEKELWGKYTASEDWQEKQKLFEMILDMNSEPVQDKDT